MSKSKGNGIDPVEMIEKYGADVVRFALMILTTEGQDIKLSPVKFETGRNFANKPWNAVRFVHPHLDAAVGADGKRIAAATSELHLADRWILARLDETIKAVTESLEPRGADGSSGLRFSEAAQALYRFTWDDFCSNYLEIRKKTITSAEATLEKAGGGLRVRHRAGKAHHPAASLHALPHRGDPPGHRDSGSPHHRQVADGGYARRRFRRGPQGHGDPAADHRNGALHPGRVHHPALASDRSHLLHCDDPALKKLLASHGDIANATWTRWC